MSSHREICNECLGSTSSTWSHGVTFEVGRNKYPPKVGWKKVNGLVERRDAAWLEKKGKTCATCVA